MDQLFAGEGRRVDRRLVEAQVVDHRVEVGVGGERAEIAQRGELTLDVVGRRTHHQPQEGEPTRFAEPTDDAEVEQRGAAVGEHEQVPGMQVAVEDAVDERPFHEGDHPGADHGGVSMPARCMLSTSSKPKPDSRSITSTRRVTSFGCGRGTT